MPVNAKKVQNIHTDLLKLSGKIPSLQNTVDESYELLFRWVLSKKRGVPPTFSALVLDGDENNVMEKKSSVVVDDSSNVEDVGER